MKIPSGMAGTDARLARRSFAELRGRDARIEDAQYEAVPVRSAAPARAEAPPPAAALARLLGRGRWAVGDYLFWRPPARGGPRPGRACCAPTPRSAPRRSAGLKILPPAFRGMVSIR